ncbi:hypothetical protein [Pseudomonas ovata]|uniref:hypothetical protein n=1 Tax=Pseudomonas ovata TaxID=1839709 RepID=UPI0030C857C0
MPLADPIPLVAYPAGLPSPLRDGYGFTPTSPLRRSTKMSGRTQTRRAYKSVPTVAAVRWMFSSSEALAFESWFDEKIDSGAAWFECPLLVPGGMGTYKARFVDIYEGPTLFGVDHWSFTANLELWERPILRGGWSDFPDIVIGSPIIDIAINDEWPE